MLLGGNGNSLDYSFNRNLKKNVFFFIVTSNGCLKGKNNYCKNGIPITTLDLAQSQPKWYLLETGRKQRRSWVQKINAH